MLSTGRPAVSETGPSQLLEPECGTLRQFATRPETTGTVIRPVQAVTEDIFIWTVRPRQSVNSFNCAVQKYSYLLTYLPRPASAGHTSIYGTYAYGKVTISKQASLFAKKHTVHYSMSKLACHCQCNQPKRPGDWTFDLLILKEVSELHVTWATSVAILVFLGLSVLDLGPMYYARMTCVNIISLTGWLMLGTVSLTMLYYLKLLTLLNHDLINFGNIRI